MGQRLKQIKKCSLIPYTSSNTHQIYERAMIREVLRVLSLSYNFSIIKPTLDLFSQGLKIQIRVIVMFRVSTQLFLPITSQNLSKIQNFISEDYAFLQWFQSQSPIVCHCCRPFITQWLVLVLDRQF